MERRALLSPSDIAQVHAAFSKADPRQTGTIDVWAFRELVESMPWELTQDDMFELVASVEKEDPSGLIAFPAVLKAVDGHVRARVEESADFEDAWRALGGRVPEQRRDERRRRRVREGAAGASTGDDGSDTISVDALLRACKRFDLGLNVSELVQFASKQTLTFDEFRSFVLTGSTTDVSRRSGFGTSILRGREPTTSSANASARPSSSIDRSHSYHGALSTVLDSDDDSSDGDGLD